MRGVVQRIGKHGYVANMVLTHEIWKKKYKKKKIATPWRTPTTHKVLIHSKLIWGTDVLVALITYLDLRGYLHDCE